MEFRKEFISSMPIFGGISEDELDLIISLTDEQEFEPGDIIVEEGELGNLIYVIKEGKVIVEKKHPKTGEIEPVVALGENDSFGEMALIDPQPRAATVTALKHTTMITLSATALHEIYVKKPEVYLIIIMNLAREMSRRLRIALEVLASLHSSVYEALPNLHF